MSGLLALLDGDIILYRTGFASMDVSERIAKARMSETIGTIMDTVGASSYRMYLSDSKGNFRLSLFPRYKANRPDNKPVHHEALSNYITNEWGAMIAWGEEADDALGIDQSGDTTVICSIDKDLKQIPGRHYNWVTGEFKTISESEGLYLFYKQLLTGDSTDNITVKEGLSCPGIGGQKAYQALEGCVTEEQYWETVCKLYYKQCKDQPLTDIHNRITLTGQLVKIRQKEGQIWNPPLPFLDVA